MSKKKMAPTSEAGPPKNSGPKRTPTSHDVRLEALAWLDAGASVLPIKADGSKSPDVDTWAPLMEEPEDRETVAAYYGETGRTGLGIVFGYNGFECLDFDTREIWSEFLTAAESAGLEVLLHRVATGYSERTPNGLHLIWRCTDPEAVGGNTKLAAEAVLDEDGEPVLSSKGKPTFKTVIETRGRGGYAIVAPSHGMVHESGKPYKVAKGSPASVAAVTPEEREDLLALARSLDQRPVKPPRERPTRLPDGTRPGDAYNAGGPSWAEILEPHGWTQLHTLDGLTRWCRPGKSVGVSATSGVRGEGGEDLLWVFSTNAESFEAERSYDRFGAYAALEHDRDHKAAARALAEEGYGDEPEPERFALVSAKDLALPVPPMRWMVHRVWPQNSHGPLAGAKKSLKSWNALALAVAVASGRPYLGEFAVNKPGPVLIFNGEGGQEPFQRRYQRICAAYDVEPGSLPLAVTFGVGDLAGRAFRDAIKAHLDEVQPVLVILDPLYTYHPSGIEAQNLYERGRMLGDLSHLVGYDASLLVVDHYRKTGGANLDLDEIGQSGVAQWADSWILQAHREEPDLEAGTFRLAVEHGSRQWGGQRWEIDWECGAFDEETGEPDGSVFWKLERSNGRAKRTCKLNPDELQAEIMIWTQRNPPTTKKRIVNAVMDLTRAGRERVTTAFEVLAERNALVSVAEKVPQERGGKTVSVRTEVWKAGDLRLNRTGQSDRDEKQ
jgi:hypothetical protein